MSSDSSKPLATAASLMEDITGLTATCAQLWEVSAVSAKQQRIETIDAELAQGWDQVADAPGLQKERTRLAAVVEPLATVQTSLTEMRELLELAAEEDAPELLADVHAQVVEMIERLAQLELAQFLNYPHASEDCYLDIHFGSGGVESQDWAQMLKRMYVGYVNQRNWKTTVIEETLGEAGLKSATLLIAGANAFGFLRTEAGVHRLVRKSPFDSNHRRHTTFASVFVYPVLPDDEEVEVNSGDLRIDTYRASGAGGQHVNTTDSAVRITHLPTSIVVQCQNDRSQHKNRSTAMSMLRSRLQLQVKEEEAAKRKELEDTKADISWGSQIRSYVLDQARVKDLRTGVENGSPQAVLDGDLHRFIEASLRAGI